MLVLLLSVAFSAPLDLAASQSSWLQSCEAGDVTACVQAGAGALAGLAGESDPVLAAQLFDQACEAGDAIGCRELGTLHKRGPVSVRDLDAANAAYDRACTLGSESACQVTGREVAPRWEGSRAVSRAREVLGQRG